jgi:hypothetical protein
VDFYSWQIGKSAIASLVLVVVILLREPVVHAEKIMQGDSFGTQENANISKTIH